MKNRLVFRMLSGQRKQKKRRGEILSPHGRFEARQREKRADTRRKKRAKQRFYAKKNLKNSSKKTDQTLDRKRPL